MAYRLYRALTSFLWPAALPVAAVNGFRAGAEWQQRLGRLPDVSPGSVWLHAASVGEVAAIGPLVRALEDRSCGVFLSVVTRTGRDAAERSGARRVAYAPLDFVPAVRRALGAIRPRALLLTETELWPNLIWECDRAKIPVGVVNGRLSWASVKRYLLPGSPIREPAARLAFAACRTESDAQRFVALGVDPSCVSVVGDMKYDKLTRPLGERARADLAGSLGVPEGALVVVFGSVRPLEEAAVAVAAAELLASSPDAFAIIAPRHLDRVSSLMEILASNGIQARLRSQPGASEQADARVLVLDSTGELAQVYALGALAFVGGTLADYGGHDPLEPAAQGVPVVLGPHTESCSDSAERLRAGGGAFLVTRPSDLGALVLELTGDRAALARAGTRALDVVAEGRGAVGRTMELLTAMGIADGA